MVAGNKVYPSKKGVVVYIPIVILAGLVSVSVIVGDYWGSIFCAAIVLAVVLPMLLNTSYTITDDGALKVRCGFFVNILIEVNTIKKNRGNKKHVKLARFIVRPAGGVL